mmetsp:Transcript_30571/g.71114  ORF Transcript_30571/g.71114 Transcript_30571/m.71114 type:complete len:219 (-) Transcript_30571:313-969(-)
MQHEIQVRKLGREMRLLRAEAAGSDRHDDYPRGGTLDDEHLGLRFADLEVGHAAKGKDHTPPRVRVGLRRRDRLHGEAEPIQRDIESLERIRRPAARLEGGNVVPCLNAQHRLVERTEHHQTVDPLLAAVPGGGAKKLQLTRAHERHELAVWQPELLHDAAKERQRVITHEASLRVERGHGRDGRGRLCGGCLRRGGEGQGGGRGPGCGSGSRGRHCG